MKSQPIPILLVDDRPENLVSLKAILDDPGYRLVTATSGEQALSLLLREEFALVLLDVAMPGMTGFDVADYLKRRERTRHLPIVFVTAVANDIAQIYEAYSVGAVDYLVKPLDARIVRSKVAVLADLFRQRREIERQAQLLRENEEREHALRMVELRAALDRRYRELVEGVEHALAWSADPDTLALTFVSRQASRLLGYDEAQLSEPGFFLAQVHPDDRAAFRSACDEAVRLGAARTCDHRVIAADGGLRWLHTSVRGEVTPLRLHGLSLDVTELKRAEETQRLLAEVSRLLAEPLDHAEALERLARVVVPRFADACLIDMLVDHALRPLAAAPGAPPSRAELDRAGWYDPRDPRGAARVFESKTPAVHPASEHSAWTAAPLGPEHSAVVRALGAVSYIVVPLEARGRTLGTITFVASTSQRRFGGPDLALATEIAGRTALGADNVRLYAEARRATRARDEMLAIVSHDLRNPLSTIDVSAQLLRELPLAGEGAARATKAIDSIHRASAGMARLLRDLIDIERIELHRLSLEPGVHRVGALLTAVSELFEPLARSKSIALELDVDATSTLELSCDRERLLQVFSNLIGNAIKFTPPGGRISIAAERDGDAVRFSVRDTGPGMERDALEHVFVPFWQAKDTARLGLGLGLAIAKGIVEAHGGAIGAESELGGGTSFHFTLPLGQPLREQHAQPMPRTS